MAKGKVIIDNVSFGNTSESAVGINLPDPVWSILCDLPFADPIPKTYIAAEVVGLGFLL